MSLRRYLGAGWASVHGPTDQRKLALWTLELGFAGLAVAPSPRPIDWRSLRREIADLPFGLPVLVGPRPARGCGLGSARESERVAAAAAVRGACAEAIALGIDTVVVDPGLVPVLGETAGDDLTEPSERRPKEAALALLARRRPERDAALDRVCRALHGLARERPELHLALAPSRYVTGVADPDGLAAIFEDLASLELGYWHACSITARRNQVLGEDQGAWLERFADRMVGLSLGDAADGLVDLPPGAGLVDYALVASYTRRSVPLPGVVELDPAVDPGEIPGVRSFLTKFGL